MIPGMCHVSISIYVSLDQYQLPANYQVETIINLIYIDDHRIYRCKFYF
jgi:hypothetical protein